MKILSISVVLLSTIVLTGCSTITVSYDYDIHADFASMKTYNWFGLPKKVEDNGFAAKRIKESVNKELAAKGFRQVFDNPDFFIGLSIVKQARREIVDWCYPYPSYGGYGGGHIIDVYEEGTLILDFVNAVTKELLWRGSATSVIEYDLTPKQREERINEAVAKVLENFPPVQTK